MDIYQKKIYSVIHWLYLYYIQSSLLLGISQQQVHSFRYINTLQKGRVIWQ